MADKNEETSKDSTTLIDDNFREVSVYLVPAMVSIAMQTSPYRLRHRSLLSLFPRRTMSLGTHGGALSAEEQKVALETYLAPLPEA